MKTDNTEVRRIIVNKLVNSGINITPHLLDFILALDNPIHKVSLLIKDSSFIAGFKSHLTEKILTQISNEEIIKAMKRNLIKKETSIDGKPSGIEPKPKVPGKSLVYQENYSKTTRVLNKSTDIFSKRMNNIENKTQSPSPTIPIQTPIISKINQKSKINIIGGTKSTLTFNPIAKEYEFQFGILKDPTGKLYTNGDYQDFYELTLDKYNRLRTLMKKRTEVHNADNINNILRLSSRVEVSVIALVSKIRKTKNGNMFMTLEDLTGLISVLIRKDSENQNNTKIAERTLSDQMVYIEGTYTPGDKGRPGIIYGNYITKIDIPRDYNTNKSNEPLSIALITSVPSNMFPFVNLPLIVSSIRPTLRMA